MLNLCCSFETGGRGLVNYKLKRSCCIITVMLILIITGIILLVFDVISDVKQHYIKNVLHYIGIKLVWLYLLSNISDFGTYINLGEFSLSQSAASTTSATACHESAATSSPPV